MPPRPSAGARSRTRSTAARPRARKVSHRSHTGQQETRYLPRGLAHEAADERRVEVVGEVGARGDEVRLALRARVLPTSFIPPSMSRAHLFGRVCRDRCRSALTATHEPTVPTPSTTPVLERSVHVWEQPAMDMGELAADKQN